MLKESTKLSINQKREINLGNFYQKASKNQHFQGVIYLIDSRYFDAELVANYNFWKFNVLKNDVAGKKLKSTVTKTHWSLFLTNIAWILHKLPLISSEVTERRCIWCRRQVFRYTETILNLENWNKWRLLQIKCVNNARKVGRGSQTNYGEYRIHQMFCSDKFLSNDDNRHL